MDPIQAIFSALSADAGLTGSLAEYQGAPAIFSGDVLPADFEPGAAPWIWIRQPHAQPGNQDSFPAGGAPGANFARTVELDVSFYAVATESADALDSVAQIARVLLHRQLLPAPSGQREPMCSVSGPFGAPTSDPSIAGRRLSARLDLRG